MKPGVYVKSHCTLISSEEKGVDAVEKADCTVKFALLLALLLHIKTFLIKEIFKYIVLQDCLVSWGRFRQTVQQPGILGVQDRAISSIKGMKLPSLLLRS